MRYQAGAGGGQAPAPHLVNVTAGDYRVVHLALVRAGEVDEVVQAARLLSAASALADEHRHVGELPQLDQVGRYLVLPVEVPDHPAREPEPGPSALQPLHRAHDPDV